MSDALSNATRLRRAGLTAVLAALGALALAAPGANADTYRVDTEADLADASPGDGDCEAADGTCALRAAFEEAGAQSSDDRVRVPKGHYELTEGQLLVAANGKLDVEGDLNHGRETVIDAISDSRVIEVESGAELKLFGVTVTGGDVVGGGGGILTGLDSRTTLVRSRVNGNRTFGDGGGIANGGRLVIDKSDIETNSSDANGGGLSNNEQFSDFAAAAGPEPDPPSISLELSRVNNNDAELGGGGVYAGFGLVETYRSTVSGNTAGVYGGGILGSVSGSLPRRAAGPEEFDTKISLETSTVSSNKSGVTGPIGFGDGAGGGVLLFGGALLESRNSTIAANTNNAGEIDTGAGLALDGGSANLRNSIVADNRTNGQMDNCRVTAGTIESLGFNLENDAECSFDMGSDVQDVNPQIGRLRLNRSGIDGPKGRGETHRLARSSPAIDAGPNDCGPLDQRGLGRPLGPRCDIGAFERKK